MKTIFSILLSLLLLSLFMLGLTACLNKTKPMEQHKSFSKTFDGHPVMYLSIAPSKIELVQLNVPTLDYRTAKEYNDYYSNGRYPDGVYTKGQNDSDAVLMEGQIIIYNRFYEMQERLTFKDSLVILDERFFNDKRTSTFSSNYKDSIFIDTYFYENGKLIKIERPHHVKEEYLVEKDGKISHYSARKGRITIVDFWDEAGHFKERQRYTYLDEESTSTSLQEIIDRKNKLIKRIE